MRPDYLKSKKQTCDSWCQHINPDHYPEKKHTFRRWTWAVGGYLPHAASMAAECHQPWNDCSLPKSHISSNDCSPVLCWVRILQFFFNGLKQPFSSNKHWVCGYARHLKQQRLQQNVLRLIGDETSWKRCVREESLPEEAWHAVKQHSFRRQHHLEALLLSVIIRHSSSFTRKVIKSDYLSSGHLHNFCMN